ncbi:hypothetical protein [Azospirillum largimobile]
MCCDDTGTKPNSGRLPAMAVYSRKGRVNTTPQGSGPRLWRGFAGDRKNGPRATASDGAGGRVRTGRSAMFKNRHHSP